MPFMSLTIYLACLASSLLSGYIGMRQFFTIDRLSFRLVINGALILLLAFTFLMVAWAVGYFPQEIAAPFMMIIYSLVAGFFIGSAIRLATLRANRGVILYIYRSFWSDHAPNLAAIVLILFGLYRTAILTELPVTGIRVTSGLSIMSAGLFGWTLRMVPEFRSSGILILDRWIHWSRVLAWKWVSEEVILIEYLHSESPIENHQIRSFTTTIPAIDRKRLEDILSAQLDEYRDQREELLPGNRSG